MGGYKFILSTFPFLLVIVYFGCICSCLPITSRADLRTPRIVNGNQAEANVWTEDNTKIVRKPFAPRTTTFKPNLKIEQLDQLENNNDRRNPAYRTTTVEPYKQQDKKISTPIEITSKQRLPSRLTKLQIIKTSKDNINESPLEDAATHKTSNHRFSLKKEEVTPIPSPILLENESKVDVENDSIEFKLKLDSGGEIEMGEEKTVGNNNFEETVEKEANNQREIELELEETEVVYPIENVDHPEEEPEKEFTAVEEEGHDYSSEELEDKEEETGREKVGDSSQESEEKQKEAIESEEFKHGEQYFLKPQDETTNMSEDGKSSNEFADQEKETDEKKEDEETEYEFMGEEVVGDEKYKEASSDVEYKPFNVSDPKKLQELLKKALEEISRRRLQFEMSKQETDNRKDEKPNHSYTIKEFTQEVMRLGFCSKQLSLMKTCDQESLEVSGKTMMMEEADKISIHRIVQRAWRTLITDDEKRYQHVKEETSRGISDLLENERRKILELREKTEEELAML